FRVRCPHVSLKQHDHAQEGRWMRSFSRTGVAVHLLEFRLKRVIEQLVPVPSQKSEKRPHPIQALDQPLFLCCQLDRWIPSRHRLISSPSNWIDRVKADKYKQPSVESADLPYPSEFESSVARPAAFVRAFSSGGALLVPRPPTGAGGAKQGGA